MTATHRFWVNDADKVNQKEERFYSSFLVFKFILLDFSQNTSRAIKKGGDVNLKN
jgi:hypothetical protein